MITTDLTLDVTSTEVQGYIMVKYGDTARRLRLRFQKNGEPWVPGEGARGVFTAIKADSKILYNPCTYDNGVFVYDFTPQTTSCTGQMRCELRIFLGDMLVVSPRFDMEVVDTVYHEGDKLDSTSEAIALRSIADDMTALMQTIEDSLANGDFVGEQGKPGADGTTPHIGENGNWFLGTEDTGVNARNGASWELLNRFSIAEEDAVNLVVMDSDSKGNPFACREICVKTATSAPADKKSSNFSGHISINGGVHPNANGYLNSSAHAMYVNAYFVEVCGGVFRVTYSSRQSTVATEESAIREFRLNSPAEDNVFYGDFEIWGVRV